MRCSTLHMHSAIHRECEMKSYGSGRVLVTSGRNNGTWHTPNLMLHRGSEDKKRIRVVVALIDGQRSRCCCKTINLKYAPLARTFFSLSFSGSVFFEWLSNAFGATEAPIRFCRRRSIFHVVVFSVYEILLAETKWEKWNELPAPNLSRSGTCFGVNVRTFIGHKNKHVMRNVWAAFGCIAKSCEFRELYDLACSSSDFTHKRWCWCVCLV